MFKRYPHLFLEDPEVEEEEEEEEVPPADPPQDPPADPSPPPTPTPIDPANASLEELAKVNPALAKALADKAEAERVAAEEKAAREENDRKKKEEEGSFQALYEEEKAKNQRLADDKKKQDEILGKYQGSVNQILEDVMKTIPEERRGLIPSNYSSRQKLEYITTNAALLGAKVMNASGAVPPSDDPPSATQEQQLVKEVQELADKPNKTAQDHDSLWEKTQKLKELRAQNQ